MFATSLDVRVVLHWLTPVFVSSPEEQNWEGIHIKENLQTDSQDMARDFQQRLSHSQETEIPIWAQSKRLEFIEITGDSLRSLAYTPCWNSKKSGSRVREGIAALQQTQHSGQTGQQAWNLGKEVFWFSGLLPEGTAYI